LLKFNSLAAIVFLPNSLGKIVYIPSEVQGCVEELTHEEHSSAYKTC